MKYIYVLISSSARIHYGAYADDLVARKKAREYEKLDGLPQGDIDIFEIPETWMVGFRVI